MLNIFCAMCCFVGLYLGIAVSQDPSSRTWMFAIAAGMFCYVGLVEMVSLSIDACNTQLDSLTKNRDTVNSIKIALV